MNLNDFASVNTLYQHYNKGSKCLNTLIAYLCGLEDDSWDRAGKTIKEKSSWYMESYPVILDCFAKTRDNLQKSNDMTSQVIRSSLVGSWVPTILKPKFTPAKIEAYCKVTSELTDKKIDGIIVEEGKLTIKDGNIKFEIFEILKATKPLVSRSETSYTPNIPAVSKLLHFDLPALFPILDKNVAEELYSVSNPSKSDYCKYFNEIVGLVSDKIWEEKIAPVAKDAGVTELRLIDCVIFMAKVAI
jgi:hypothetical protein